MNESESNGLPDQWESIRPSRLQRLLEIGTTLSSTLDLKLLLDMVIDAATDFTDTEYATILLVDGRSGELYFAAARGITPSEADTVVPQEGSIAGRIVRTGEPLIMIELEQENRDYAEVRLATNYVTRNVLAVPLIAKEKVIGALEVFNKRSVDNYSRQDVGLLRLLASQAAVAIENARLFQQTDLIAELMHELKTPLMALTAASELLAREDLAERRPELVDMIQRETMRLSKMAQAFLDLARLESGRAQISREPVNLHDLIIDVVRLQEPQANARDITIMVQLPDRLPVVLGDYDRLKQVLLNLTNNAIKYNVIHGRVDVLAGVVGDELEIEITDTGPGITPENLPHLFERFYRISDSDGFTKGTGLGLSIAARILEEHGGRIEVESEPGQGSTFCCFLPVHKL